MESKVFDEQATFSPETRVLRELSVADVPTQAERALDDSLERRQSGARAR